MSRFTANRDRRKYLIDAKSSLKRSFALMFIGLALMLLIAYVSVNDVFAFPEGYEDGDYYEIEMEKTEDGIWLNKTSFEKGRIGEMCEMRWEDGVLTMNTCDLMPDEKLIELGLNPLSGLQYLKITDEETNDYSSDFWIMQDRQIHWNDDGSVVTIQGEIYADSCEDYDVSTCTLINPPDELDKCSPVTVKGKFFCDINSPHDNFLRMLLAFGVLSVMITGLIFVLDDDEIIEVEKNV